MRTLSATITIFLILGLSLAGCGEPDRPKLTKNEQSEYSNHSLTVSTAEVVAHQNGVAPESAVPGLMDAAEWMEDMLDTKACAKTDEGILRSVARDWSQSLEISGLDSTAVDLRDAVSDAPDCSKFA